MGGCRFHDLGPFRALRRSLWSVGALADAGYGWNVEMNVRAIELGMKVVEVRLPTRPRVRGSDRISRTLRGVVGACWGILRMLFVSGSSRARDRRDPDEAPGPPSGEDAALADPRRAGARDLYVEMVRETVKLARTLPPRSVVADSPPNGDPRAALPGVRDCAFLPLQGEGGAVI